MPAFAMLFTSIFTSLVGFLAQFIARKYAFVIAALGVLLTVSTVFYAAISTTLNGLVWLLPSDPGVDLAIWFAVPPVLPVAVSAALSVDTACAVFLWNKEQLKMLLA